MSANKYLAHSICLLEIGLETVINSVPSLSPSLNIIMNTEIENGENGKIVIKGNNGIAMASGFNYYLKNYLNVDYNPLYESNIAINAIKPVDKKIIKEAQFDLRYALNFCTYSYTMAFWNWDEYEKFLDWCAMNGINLVLDIANCEDGNEV